MGFVGFVKVFQALLEVANRHLHQTFEGLSSVKFNTYIVCSTIV